MSNTYFQFKQFRIDQDVAGMKVTTDGCLFGALIDANQEGTILDIGTGTGLLSLMLAQRTTAFIDAIEIDAQVAKQANDNTLASPWKDRLKVHNTSLQEFEPTKRYEQIISNPPFFKDNALGTSKKKNLAIHSDLLPMEDLLNKSLELISDDGLLCIMYPPYEMGVFIEAAIGKGFYLQKQILVRNRAAETPIRSICSFSKHQTKSPMLQELVIRSQDNEYTGDFKVLLKDYYLHL